MKKCYYRTKHFIFILFVSLFFPLAIICCSNKGDLEKEHLEMQIDSLEHANNKIAKDLNDLNEFVTILADGLDSIAYQENILFSNKGKEGISFNKEQIKQNLEFFEELLAKQKEKIQTLTDSLRSKGANMDRLKALVEYLNKQLEEKDAVIKQLRKDIDKKNVNLAQLNKSVQFLTDNNNKLSSKVEYQTEVLKRQTEMINEGFVIIGTKQELKEKGIIAGGFLKKKQINTDGINKNLFMRIDIREFTEIPIRSNMIKILTTMPSTSYKIEKSSGSYSTLHITDPTLFWSISNYLVIQTN